MVNKITTDDIFDFFRKKNIPSGCSQCGHNKSSIFSTKEPYKPRIAKIALHSYDGEGKKLDHNDEYDTIPLVCDNCGNIRYFLVETILKSMEKEENE